MIAVSAAARCAGSWLPASRAHLGQLVERLALVCRIALDRLDQVGNQIGAALELRVDAAPAFGDHGAAADKPVVGEDRPQDDQYGNAENDIEDHVGDAICFAPRPSMRGLRS